MVDWFHHLKQFAKNNVYFDGHMHLQRKDKKK